MIQPLFEHRLKLAGYRTRVLELEGEGVPVVMLHGYADSADTWRHTLSRLARAGRRAIAVDLPGFATADPLRSTAILPQLDEFALAAVRYVGGRRSRGALVVGNSLGGCVALRLAERRSPELDGVVAVAPAGLAMSPMLSLIELDPLLHTLLALPAPVPSSVLRAAVARIYLRLAFANPRAVDHGVVAAFTWHLRHRSTVARYLDTAHRMLPELHEPFNLSRISTRVLLVWGDRDRLVFHRGAQRVLDAVPGARLEVLPGVGHCPQIEASERFAQLLLEFAGAAQAAAA